MPRNKTAPVPAAVPARHSPMKVLVAVDGSVFTRRMIDFLLRHWGVNREPPRFTVLHAVGKVSPHALNVLDRKVLKRYYQDEAASVFRPVHRRFNKLGIEADFVYKIGPAATVIARTAEDGGFDVVMMGAQGANALSRLVMGSVVARVMAECKVPVLIVP